MDNLLLQGSYFESTLKISNFGYSKSSVLDSMAKTAAVGAPAYTPPELLLLAARSDGSAYDGAAIDVWASGIILYCMISGKLPFLVSRRPPEGSIHSFNHFRVLCNGSLREIHHSHARASRLGFAPSLHDHRMDPFPHLALSFASHTPLQVPCAGA